MDIRRVLVIAGIALLAAGALWPWLQRMPFGRLPGDIAVHRQNFSLYFPLGTCILVSGVLTLLFWFFRK